MFDRPLVAFDIETIPDPDYGRRVLGIEGDDDAVVNDLAQRRLQETSGHSRYPQLPWHRVVSICMTVLDPTSGSIEMHSCGDDPNDEAGLIASFFDRFGPEPRPRLLSWNGNGFDLPVLRYRAMKHGIAAPAFYRAEVDAEGRSSTYLSRYHDSHIDVMDLLSGYGASPRAGLGTVCDLLGLPGKSFLDREVYEHFLAGEHARIVEYCKLDSLETMLVFLAWSVHHGSLAPTDLAAYVPRIRALVAAQVYPAWGEVARQLASWPPWLAGI